MSDFPRYATYRERLAPDAPPVEVELPQSRHDAFDLLATIHRLAEEDPVAWKATVRQVTATDWYMLALFLSGAQRLDPFTGRPEIDCDFQFNFARELQFDGDGVIDYSARQHFKSFWRCYVGVTAEVFRDPDISILLLAHEKAAAEKHGSRWKREMTDNPELKLAWDEVLYADPEREAPLWSVEKGCTVRRRISSTTPTFSWYAIDQLPTGARGGLFIFDDCENERTVESDGMREKTLQRFNSALELAGRAARVWINGTFHHPQGLMNHLRNSGAWRHRCHTAEDPKQDPPDIARLYDEAGGKLPLRDENRPPMILPKEVREIRLEGAATFLHPLELALKRLQAMSVPGGLANYYMQNMGDPLAGQSRRLDPDWIKWYDAPPVEWARGTNLYLVIDPSKGVGDPTFARMEACKADQTISWVDGFRRRLSPSEFGPAVFLLAMQWVGIGARLVEIRVEEFAQSTWAHNLRTYFDSRNQYVCPIIACSRHNTNNKESAGRQREWAGLEPLYRMGRRLFPRDGIRAFDEMGHAYDLVDFYVKREYTPFPLPLSDDGLAADYLLAVTKGKNEAGKEVDLALEFPESDEEWAESSRDSARWARRHSGGAQEDDWMLADVM